MNREWITEYLFEKKISFLSLKKPKCVWEAFSYIYLLYVYKQQKCIITMIHKCIRCGITFEQPFYLQSRNSTFICTLATIMIWTCTMRFNLSIRLLIPYLLICFCCHWPCMSVLLVRYFGWIDTKDPPLQIVLDGKNFHWNCWHSQDVNYFLFFNPIWNI